jgi:hypothetical protein
MNVNSISLPWKARPTNAFVIEKGILKKITYGLYNISLYQVNQGWHKVARVL